MSDLSTEVSDPRSTNEPSELLRAASHLTDLMDDLGKSIVALEDRLAPVIFFDGPTPEDGGAMLAEGPIAIPRHSAVLTRLSNVADGIESLCRRVDQITTSLRV